MTNVKWFFCKRNFTSLILALLLATFVGQSTERRQPRWMCVILNDLLNRSITNQLFWEQFFYGRILIPLAWRANLQNPNLRCTKLLCATSREQPQCNYFPIAKHQYVRRRF